MFTTQAIVVNVIFSHNSRGRTAHHLVAVWWWWDFGSIWRQPVISKCVQVNVKLEPALKEEQRSPHVLSARYGERVGAVIGVGTRVRIGSGSYERSIVLT